VVAHDQSARLVRLGDLPGGPARSSLTSSSRSFTRPRSSGPGREGFPISEAVRGEGPRSTTAENFVEELARATRRAPSSTSWPARRARHDDGRPGPLPEHRPALRRRAGPDPQRVPVAPASHYVMGGSSPTSTGGPRASAASTRSANPPVRRGANRLASNSRPECFVFGRRAPPGLDDPEPGAVTAVPPRFGRRLPPTRRARPSGASRGLERTADGLIELQADPHPLAPLRRLRSPGRTRGGPTRGPSSPRPIPPSMGASPSFRRFRTPRSSPGFSRAAS
jgi:hypothetical protein